MMYINRVNGFQTVRPPHQEWLPTSNINQNHPNVGDSGKGSGPRTLTVVQNQNQIVDSQTHIIQDPYDQIPSLSVNGTDQKVTAWSVARHAHHGPAFGMNLSKHNLTESDLDSIAEK